VLWVGGLSVLVWGLIVEWWLMAGLELEEEGGEVLDGEFAVGRGEMGGEGVEGGDEELGDLVGGVEVAMGGGIVVGVFVCEEPSGGAPVAVVFGGAAEIGEEFDFEVGLGLGELGGELGIAGGGAGDRGGRALDEPGGRAAAATVAEEGKDALALLGGEDGGTAAAGRGGIGGGWFGHDWDSRG
jgi:hypothetical protein